MKKLLLILALILPQMAFASFAVPWFATSTSQKWIQPVRLNNAYPTIVVPNIIGTSTNDSRFAGTLTSLTSLNASTSQVRFCAGDGCPVGFNVYAQSVVGGAVGYFNSSEPTLPSLSMLVQIASGDVNPDGYGVKIVHGVRVITLMDTDAFQHMANLAMFNGTGNFGIGATSTPYAKLTVVGDSVSSSTMALVPISGQTGNILDVYNTSGTVQDVITLTGNLGLGTTTPAWPLDVAGTRPSIAITDNSAQSGDKHWLISSMGGSLYIGTSSDTYATSSTPAFSLNGNRPPGISVSSSTPLALISGHALSNSPFKYFLDIASSTQTSTTTLLVLDNTGRLGLGTTTPFSTLSVKSGTGVIPFNVSSSTQAASSTLFQIDPDGNIITGGGTPVISCAATCAFDAHSNDSAGTINIAGVQTSVTVTWNTPKPWAPHCTMSDSSTASTADISTLNTTTMTISFSASIGTASVYYICVQ